MACNDQSYIGVILKYDQFPILKIFMENINELLRLS